MSRLDNGEWRVDIPRLSPGKYAYKFLVDGKNWQNDRENRLREDDRFGGDNSVLVVP